MEALHWHSLCLREKAQPFCKPFLAPCISMEESANTVLKRSQASPARPADCAPSSSIPEEWFKDGQGA
eukprot:1159497-Pelagomonas_calceolata.AAC.9